MWYLQSPRPYLSMASSLADPSDPIKRGHFLERKWDKIVIQGFIIPQGMRKQRSKTQSGKNRVVSANTIANTKALIDL